MNAFDLAWSVLKADPRMQAFEASGYHPETGEARPDIRNLGTVDPAVLAMGYRQISGSYGDYPQAMLSRLMGGVREPRTYALPLQAQGDPTGSDDGFLGLGEGSQDYFGVSREPRPVAETREPRIRSPQHIIDVFKPKGNPMTPEDEAELARRLRMAQQ